MAALVLPVHTAMRAPSPLGGVSNPPWDIPSWDISSVLVASALHSNEYQAFVKRLCAARKKAGLSQAQVAKALGKPQSFVSKCESGERRVDAVELAAYVSLYGVSLENLVPTPRIKTEKRR